MPLAAFMRSKIVSAVVPKALAGKLRQKKRLLATGSEFYGPHGMYPFAGHECARAFAMISTDVADCNDNLEVTYAFLVSSIPERIIPLL